MSFVRPEAASLLKRYQGLIAALGVVALGAYWAMFAYAGLALVGWAFIVAGVVLAVSFGQRALFGGRGDGAGVVEAIEGQITYYSAAGGGVVAIRELTAVSYDDGVAPPVWRLLQEGGHELVIPQDARDTEALFDALTTLPGLSAEKLLAAQRGVGGHARVIWHRDMQPAIDTAALRLHS